LAAALSSELEPVMIRASLAFDAAIDRAWDAIVLGAGPAGALAARQLAAGGARVLLVDKKAFPRWKVCGACLNGQALAVLRSVDLGSLAADLGGIALDGFDVRLAGRTARLALPAGIALSRTQFDAALVDAAIAAGAEYLPETRAAVGAVHAGQRRVELRHGRHERIAHARLVLVASGLGTTCPVRDPRIQTRAAVNSRIGAGCVLGDFPEFYRRKTIFMALGRHGYVGLVRVEDGLLNVAAAVDPRFLRRHGGPGNAASILLAEAGFPPVGALATAAWQGTAALTRRTWPLAAERVFVLGDAAGYVEPFTGEGIAWALASAQAVAPLALRAIERWDPSLAQAWPALHRRLVGRRQRFCRSFAILLRHPWLALPAFEVLSRIPPVSRLMIRHINAPMILSPAS
jgi:menaquinone-9 beta-reductase